jgi:hypothetical protein
VEPRVGDCWESDNYCCNVMDAADSCLRWEGQDKVRYDKQLYKLSTQAAKYLTKLPGVISQTRKALQSLEISHYRWHFRQRSTNKSVYSYWNYLQPRKWRQTHRQIEIKAFINLPCLAGALRSDRVRNNCGVGAVGDGTENFR